MYYFQQIIFNKNTCSTIIGTPGNYCKHCIFIYNMFTYDLFKMHFLNPPLLYMHIYTFYIHRKNFLAVSVGL